MIKKSNYDRFGSTDGKSSGNPFEVDKDLDSTWTIYSHNLRYFEAVSNLESTKKATKRRRLKYKTIINIEEIITGCAKSKV
jgi:hypothetical protein